MCLLFHLGEKQAHFFHLIPISRMRKPLTHSQCVVLALFWAALCFIVLTSSPRIDGMLVITILISGALVFIPIVKSLKKK